MTDDTKAATLAVAVLAGLTLVVASVEIDPKADGGHVQVFATDDKGAPKPLPDGAQKVDVPVLVALKDGTTEYAVITVVVVPTGRGWLADVRSALPPGMSLADSTVDGTKAAPAAALDPVLDVYTQSYKDGSGAASPLFKCACSSGAKCDWTHSLRGGSATDPAPIGLTLDSGTWSGAGCIPKVCVELAGSSSWPSTCPIK